MVRIETRVTEAIIYIEDNGHGFEKSSVLSRRQGNGLVNMKRRMQQVGGTAEVREGFGQGTKVAFHVPLK